MTIRQSQAEFKRMPAVTEIIHRRSGDVCESLAVRVGERFVEVFSEQYYAFRKCGGVDRKKDGVRVDINTKIEVYVWDRKIGELYDH